MDEPVQGTDRNLSCIKEPILDLVGDERGDNRYEVANVCGHTDVDTLIAICHQAQWNDDTTEVSFKELCSLHTNAI